MGTTKIILIFYFGCPLTTNFWIKFCYPEVHQVYVSFQNTFRTPVYVTSQRRNAMGVGLVFEADLHTTEHQSHWVLQGVCLILNTD